MMMATDRERHEVEGPWGREGYSSWLPTLTGYSQAGQGLYQDDEEASVDSARESLGIECLQPAQG